MGETQATCARPGCGDEASFHFGVEAPTDERRPLAYVYGENIIGRRWFPGDTINACPKHAKQVYDHCHDAETVRMLRGFDHG